MKLITAILAGSVIATPVWADDGYHIEAVKQPELRLFFQGLKTKGDDEGIRVCGRLRTSKRAGFPGGHIDVAAYSPSGDLIAETTTDYVSSTHVHRIHKKVRARFSTVLPENLQPDSVIKVAFHRDKPRPTSNPPHAGNIAR